MKNTKTYALLPFLAGYTVHLFGLYAETDLRALFQI